MKKIIAKIVIAIAFGILIGDLAGTKVNLYDINKKPAYKPNGVRVEKQFHKKTALLTGGITAVVLAVVLLMPELRQRKRRKSK